MTKRFNIVETSASYSIAEGMTASLDLTKAFPGWIDFAQNVKDALIFSLKTALRNATAGKMEDAAAQKDAFDAVSKRCLALESGKWAAAREGGGGESRESVLARALAFVQGVTTAEAVAFIDEMVSTTLETNGIDADADVESLSDEEKTNRAKIVRAVKKSISDDPAIAIKMATFKAEDAIAKQKATLDALQGKIGESKFGPKPVEGAAPTA